MKIEYKQKRKEENLDKNGSRSDLPFKGEWMGAITIQTQRKGRSQNFRQEGR